MEIIVTGKHVDVTDAIRQYATDKASRLPRYFDRVLAINVVVDKPDNHTFQVEMITHVEHHEVFVARGRNSDLYACLDETTDKAERQLTDHKEKLRNRKHSAAR